MGKFEKNYLSRKTAVGTLLYNTKADGKLFVGLFSRQWAKCIGEANQFLLEESVREDMHIVRAYIVPGRSARLLSKKPADHL